MTRAAAALLLVAACSSGSTQAGPTVTVPPTSPAVTAAPLPGSAPAVAGGPVGRVASETFASAALGVDKTVMVYLPAGYDDAPAKRWPVLYYLHGLGGDETNWIQYGHLDHAADAIHLAAIVVMPDGDDGFYVDSAKPVDYAACMASGAGLFFPQRPHPETCVKHSSYESYITKDLIGWVDATYRTIATREGRGIAGVSMGGFGALQLSMRHPELFGAAASHSGIAALLYAGPEPYDAAKVKLVTDARTWGGSVGPIGPWVRGILGTDLANWQAHDPAVLAAKLAPGRLPLYLDCGTEDDFHLEYGATYLDDILKQRKLEHVFYLGAGHHDFDFWSVRLPESLAFFRDHLAAAR